MRVTNGMMVNNMMRNLTKNYSRMDKLQQQMASGKKFNKPSDDPIGVSRSLRLNTEVSAMDQYKRNADDVGSWLNTTEMAISNIGEILKRAKELTEQAATDTNSVNERNAIAGEIQELRNQLIQLGNTTYAGSYIFSGFKTDKALFDTEGKYYLGGGAGVKLTADEVIAANVGLGDRIGMNSVGQKVFGLFTKTADMDLSTSDTLKQKQSMKSKYLEASTANPINGPIIFDMVYNGTPKNISLAGPYNDLAALRADLSTAIGGFGGVSVDVVDNKLVLESDNGSFSIDAAGAANIDRIGLDAGQESVSRVESTDKSQLIAIFDQLVFDLRDNNGPNIRSAMTRIDTQINNINAVRAEIGVKTNRVDLTTSRILDDTVNIIDLLSKNEDADMAEVIMNVKMQENVYRASLSTGARIIQPSLVDFLR